MEKAKKPIWKKWWFWVLVVIVIGGIANSGEDSTQPTSQQAADQTEQPASGTEQAKEEKPAEQPKEQPKEEPEPENKPTISKVEFDQIKAGMTYEEVVKIIGSEGELLSEAGEKGTRFHTVTYAWEGDNGLGSNATFTFQGGKLQAKAQLGLE